MITILFKLIIITSILVLGWTIVTQPTMLLYRVREWATKKVDNGSKFFEPLICHWCGSSYFSILGFLFAFGLGIIKIFTWKLLLLLPLVVMGSSIINGLVWGTHKLIESATQYFNNGEKLMYMDIKDRKEKYNYKKKSNV